MNNFPQKLLAFNFLLRLCLQHKRPTGTFKGHTLTEGLSKIQENSNKIQTGKRIKSNQRLTAGQQAAGQAVVVNDRAEKKMAF